jgi:Tfp pilus assembly protein PilX
MTSSSAPRGGVIRPLRQAQRGVSMIVTLIALVLLLVGAAAMMRSVDTSSVLIGNLAFRRDLTNRAERAIMNARTALVSGSLSSESSRIANLASENYSAVRLDNGSNGVPKVLTQDSLFTMTHADITDADAGITLRYVIDRQCISAGAFTTSTCEVLESASDAGGSNWLRKPGGASRPVYRISVRVQGPRSTEAYFQTTFVD